MKKIIRLTESDLTSIIKRVINESDPKVGTGKKLNAYGGLKENRISETMTVYRLGEIPYNEESFFVTPDYKTWIKFYPEEEIYKITTNKLYLPLQNKSFLSWDELMSKYNSGEFTDKDVSYINPEESGIQNFEQYEIKPDNIIDLEQINLKQINLGESRKKKLDPKVGTGKKPEGSDRRLYTDENPSDTVSVKFRTKQDIVDTLNKESFKSKSHARQSQIINLIHQRLRVVLERAKDPEVKKRLRTAFEYIESKKEESKKKTQEMKEGEFTEKWSEKYKKSINCNNPKGFSQKAHCNGKHKKNEMKENELTEKCWAGYTQKGMKTMFGKKYPNCVKKTK